MRSFLRASLILSIGFGLGCGNHREHEPVPTAGSGSSVPAPPPIRFALRPLSGAPPHRTKGALTRDRLQQLAKLTIPDFTTTVRRIDDGFLDVVLSRAKPPLQVAVTIQGCLRCLPMELARWRAEAGSLKITIPPELRDLPDTTFEVEQLSLGGTPVIATYQQGWLASPRSTDPIASDAVAAYFTDGTNQIRVIVSYAGPAPDRAALSAPSAVSRHELEAVALSIVDAYVQIW